MHWRGCEPLQKTCMSLSGLNVSAVLQSTAASTTSHKFWRLHRSCRASEQVRRKLVGVCKRRACHCIHPRFLMGHKGGAKKGVRKVEAILETSTDPSISECGKARY